MIPDEHKTLTHVRDGKPTMVDVSGKSESKRSATAEVRVELGAEIMAHFEDDELHGAKGPVLQTAIIAGTMAVKKTSELIPFCHPIPVEHCDFGIILDPTGIHMRCEVSTTARTGVEMEAMTGASVAALAVYDMCKAMNKGIRIHDLHLVRKSGGKSGDYHTEPS
jgi:cyclic pyranopterin phosphate synthase